MSLCLEVMSRSSQFERVSGQLLTLSGWWSSPRPLHNARLCSRGSVQTPTTSSSGPPPQGRPREVETRIPWPDQGHHDDALPGPVTRPPATNPTTSTTLPLPLPLPLSFGRGMRGPDCVTSRHHSTALGRTVTIFAVVTTDRRHKQRKQLVGCCQSKKNKLHLCVPPSPLGTQRDFHVSALCIDDPSHHSKPFDATTKGTRGTSTSAPSCATHTTIKATSKGIRGTSIGAIGAKRSQPIIDNPSNRSPSILPTRLGLLDSSVTLGTVGF